MQPIICVFHIKVTIPTNPLLAQCRKLRPPRLIPAKVRCCSLDAKNTVQARHRCTTTSSYSLAIDFGISSGNIGSPIPFPFRLSSSSAMPKSDFRLGDSEYSPVAERIRLFYDRYPTGRIVTHLVRPTDADVTFRAEVFRTPVEREPAATGWAAERVDDGKVNAVACLENTETSAIGRALANLGLTASRHRPSREEMDKAERARVRLRRETRNAGHPVPGDPDVQRRADFAAEVLGLLNRAARLGLSIRTVDKALWQYSKERQP